MNKISEITLKSLIDEGLKARDIGKRLNLPTANIYYWAKLYKLNLPKIRKNNQEEIKNGFKICTKCNERKSLDNFFTQKNGVIHSWCKPCNKKINNKNRQSMKLKAIEYKGGSCVICGYKKCVRGLDFHHINPENKEFNIALYFSKPFEKLKEELDKCLLVCRNCHAEIHSNLIDLNKYIQI